MSLSSPAAEAAACTYCQPALPLGARPIFRVHPEVRIVLISQAPGLIAHKSGVAWDDPGGRRLREWLAVTDDLFFGTPYFGILPIGLCYPGKGAGGDLPPRPECAPRWQAPLLAMMPNVQLHLLIGQYAQRYYLVGKTPSTLSETVRHYADYLPTYFPLPHPSPRNRQWLAQRPWFGEEVLPVLRRTVADILYS